MVESPSKKRRGGGRRKRTKRINANSHCCTSGCLHTTKKDCELGKRINNLDLNALDADIRAGISYIMTLDSYNATAVRPDDETKRYYPHRSFHNIIIRLMLQITAETLYIILLRGKCLTLGNEHNIEGFTSLESLAEMMHNPSTKAFALIMEYFRPLHKYNNIDNGNNTCGTGLNVRQYCVPGKDIVSKVTNESSPSPFCGRGTKEEALARTPSMKALYKLCHERKIELLELDFAGTGGSSCFDTQLKKFESPYIHRDSLPSSIHLALLTTDYSMSCGRGKDPEPQPVKVTSHVRAKDSNVNNFVKRVSNVDKIG